MKKCQFCSEDIQDDASICWHCGLAQPGKLKEKWYFKPTAIMVIFLSVGPFVLPLIWYHPRLTKNSKIIITVIILILSYFLFKMLFDSIKSVSSHYKEIFQGSYNLQ